MNKIFQSTLTRFFVSLFLVTVMGVLLSVLATFQQARKLLYRFKEQESLAVLRNVMDVVAEHHQSIENYRHTAVEDLKQKLYHLVQSAVLVVKNFYHKTQEGKPTEEEARRQAIDLLSSISYEKDDYIFGITEDYYLIIYPNSKIKNTTLYNLRDANRSIIRDLVRAVKDAGKGKTGYVFYRWCRYVQGKRTAHQPNLSAAMYYKAWRLIIGTGVYISNIEKHVAKRKKETLNWLSERLSQMRLGKHGCAFIFDKDINILKKEIRAPSTRRLMFDELRKPAERPWEKNVLEYINLMLWQR